MPWSPVRATAIVHSILIAFLVFGPMLVEAGRSARNESNQRLRGGIEPSGDVYGWMRVAYPAAFLCMVAEGFARGDNSRWLVVGLMVFALAKALKWWAMAALGRRWTFRVIVVPGDERVTSGPYRLVRHPNYIAVIGELAGVALMAHARVTGALGIVLFGVLILRRVSVEERALDAILRPS